ncbi:MAG: CPBP family intramembrane glutamic endopeptidase [Thermonemataceae bacterium]
MSIAVQWNVADKEILLAIASLTLGFIAYWFIAQSPRIANFFQKHYSTQKAGLYRVLFQRYTGFVCLGILPTLAIFTLLPTSWAQYGVSLNTSLATWYWLLILTPLVFIISQVNAKKADNLAMYPQIRLKNWTKHTFLHEYTSWMAYLIAYELLFRGFFLFACARVMSAWVAMAFNASVYALSHLPKGRKETIGAVPIGILFSYITLTTGTIWVAVIIHILMALSNSYFSFKYQPDMHYVTTRQTA